MGSLHFLKPKKTAFRPILMLIASHRVDCLILSLRCLERFTDLDRFKHIYIFAGFPTDEINAVIGRFAKRRDNATVIQCRPPGSIAALNMAENAVIEEHRRDVVVKLDENTFVTPHWLEHLIEGYRQHRRNPETPIIAPIAPVSEAGRKALSRHLKDMR